MQTLAENLRLFKYVPPERIDILVNEKIAFTPPNRFKDPFEFRMGITRRTARNQLRELIAQVEQRAEATTPGYKELSSRQRRKGRKEMLRMQNATEQFQKGFQDTVQTQSRQIGILCLCEPAREHSGQPAEGAALPRLHAPGDGRRGARLLRFPVWETRDLLRSPG
jgi:hypothetical protein